MPGGLELVFCGVMPFGTKTNRVGSREIVKEGKYIGGNHQRVASFDPHFRQDNCAAKGKFVNLR